MTKDIKNIDIFITDEKNQQLQGELFTILHGLYL